MKMLWVLLLFILSGCAKKELLICTPGRPLEECYPDYVILKVDTLDIPGCYIVKYRKKDTGEWE